MFLNIIRYIKGYLRIRITGYAAERFLNACSHKGIFLWGLRPAGEAYEMNISIHGFRQLKPIIKKTGTKVIIVDRFGLPFFLHKYRNRKIFFYGAGFFVVLLLFFTRFVWSIEITGNNTYTDEMLLKFLDTQHVKSGMIKSKVDCPRIVKDIRKKYDGIIWVSASLEGTKLYIQIKENEDSVAVDGAEEKEDEKKEKAVDLVAEQDCVITDIVVRKGIVKVKKGDKVKKGKVLVSGQVPVKNDAGEVTAYQYHVSDADISGEINQSYEDSCAYSYEVKDTSPVYKNELFLTFGSYRFSLGGIKNKYEHFEEHSSQQKLKLFDNFYLPVTVGSRKAVPYTSEEKNYSEKEVQEILSKNFYRYCEDLEKKGVEILENDVKIYRESDLAKARGTLKLVVPVGKEKASKLKKVPKTEEKTQQGETSDGNDGNSH